MENGRQTVDLALMDVASRCFESGQVLEDDDRRRMRERQSQRYWMKACGLAPAGKVAGLGLAAGPRQR